MKVLSSGRLLKVRLRWVTDYLPPYGDGLSILPLELFLISFGTCVGGVILPLLRRMSKQLSDFQVSVVGKRREEHPLSFEEIILVFTIVSEDVVEEDIDKAMSLAEERICPLWAMIKGNVNIKYEVCINRIAQ